MMMAAPGTKLCLFCCYFFTPPRGSRMLQFVEYRNRQLQKFFDGFLPPLGSLGQRSSKSSSIVMSVDERECLQLGGGGGTGGSNKSFEGLSICNDCLSMILIITEGKGRVDQVEEQLRILQRQGIREMDRLAKEMGRLEELMEGGDAACLEVEGQVQVGSSASSSGDVAGSRREVVALRENILKAAKDLRKYNSNLSRNLSGHGALCGCSARISPSSYLSGGLTHSPSVIAPNMTTFEGGLDVDPADLAIEDVDVDVKVFCEGYQNQSPSHSPLPNQDSHSPSVPRFGSSEDDDGSEDGDRMPKDDDGSKTIPVQQSKPGRPPGDRSHLVLKLLKKARQHHHRGYQYQSLGESQSQETRGRPRDPIRDEFDRTPSGRAKCRRCGRGLNYRVDIMKSHKRACLRRSILMEALQDDITPGSRCRSRGDPEAQPELELNETTFKITKPRGTVTEPARFSGRPRDSIRNEFDMTASGKAKCRICGRCISYRVDTMKSHKRACIRAVMKTPNASDGTRDSLYPEGRPELELNETTGKMRKPRYRRRTPGTEPSSTGRPRDSIRDEFELTPEGKVKCKDCNYPITNRVDIMKSHKLRCPSNEATSDPGPGGTSKSKRKPALELDEKTGKMKRRKKKSGPKHDTPGRPRDFIWNEFDRTEGGKARCRDCGCSVAYRVDLMKRHKLRCSLISTNESPNSQKLI